MSQQYGCWVAGCAHQADYSVSNPQKRLLRPVESCSAHLGDLLGNAAKATFAAMADPKGDVIDLAITMLV